MMLGQVWTAQHTRKTGVLLHSVLTLYNASHSTEFLKEKARIPYKRNMSKFSAAD
jgi:hypothetical protein